jgi:hypothetical protein
MKSRHKLKIKFYRLSHVMKWKRSDYDKKNTHQGHYEIMLSDNVKLLQKITLIGKK